MVCNSKKIGLLLWLLNQLDGLVLHFRMKNNKTLKRILLDNNF